MRSRKEHPGFFGEYEVTVLGDGRIRLPRKAAVQLAEQGVVAVWLAFIPCGKGLVLCPESHWLTWVKQQQERFPVLETLEGFRALLSPSQRAKLDRQGRIYVSTKLREAAKLSPGQPAVVVGVGEVFEIWAPDAFAEATAEYEQAFF